MSASSRRCGPSPPTVGALDRECAGVTLRAASDTGECEVLVDSWRTPVTTVRIAHVEPRPGRLPGGGFQTRGFLVVLADDAGRRAVPIWLREPAAGDLAQLAEFAARPAGAITPGGAPQ